MNARWRDWFAIAVLRFGLSPDQFWALSLEEWLVLLNAAHTQSDSAITRSTLNALLAHDKQMKERANEGVLSK